MAKLLKYLKITIDPPIIIANGACYPINKNAHIGPGTASVNIIISTIAEGVLCAPILSK